VSDASEVCRRTISPLFQIFSEDVFQAALKLIENLSTDAIGSFSNVFKISGKPKLFWLHRFWERSCLQKQKILKVQTKNGSVRSGGRRDVSDRLRAVSHTLFQKIRRKN
jgi:hypothetical protein